ncbi:MULTISPECIES: aspartate--tRNA(Asn) ligase [Microbacterium]|nr:MULTISPECIES: aspartate--tRNA(Asn) ligase [unclassified Microbacterium]MBN9198381.1 aspartate--tRNA(Asn) ligase [Microbacterium ginsengisoli]MCK9919851.1 aspartate--tRNA(Asn) ligase [Microbacteriaceae bacterium K1510]KQR93979.1 aspartate--tRNA(Asp/Asn) ligase [Microbacterium sp. Leaf347]MBN9208089.1 aspartate--tRNA(Asn) ligase [Microbacterium ginsengisoli]ODU79932.1 MAG: aspartate--tRNA(Asn) ligase [Microbacterium sp. SCN 71-21]
MSERVLVKQLKSLPEGPVRVSGWVETVRDQKKVQFVILRDETGAVQLVNPATREVTDDADAAASVALALTEEISALASGTFLTVTGELKHDERVKLGGVEIKIATLEVAAAANPETPIAADSGLDKRMDWRFLDLRQARNNLIFRVQTTFEHALRTYWVERDYIEIHSPKLMASPSESNAELFSLDYFEDKTAYLAQSPQFFKQMAQSAGFGKIFEIAPAFRADPSFTSRHATEFTSVDAEISWIDSHEDVAHMQEELLQTAFQAVKDTHGAEIEELFGIEVQVPAVPFPRIPLAEARQIVADRGYEIPRTDGDLDPEGERQISAYVQETYGHQFVFITDYHPEIRAFYHMRDAETGLTKSYDLLFKGVEITTGAQREHRVDVLIEQAKEKGLDPAHLDFYLDFFRYGAPPHGGFGMGLARVLMLLLGEASIREVTYLFRGPTRLAP